jgi:hypothetical protein
VDCGAGVVAGQVLVPGLDDAATESAVRVVESSSRAGWTPTKEDPGLKRKVSRPTDPASACVTSACRPPGPPPQGPPPQGLHHARAGD